MPQDLFRSVACPLEAAVMAYYLIGQVHYTLRDFATAESIFKGSLAVLQQLAVYVSYAAGVTDCSRPGHVLRVLVINMLVESLVQQSKHTAASACVILSRLC